MSGSHQNLIRNFCIIAHIDHGKSTLADRFLEMADLVDGRTFENQMLDSMDIERERGITIKSQAVTLPFSAQDKQNYLLNLVDTPGHVDFSYEVSRAISSCEGALLLIDATQGVEAQTLANMYMAFEQGLEIIPVVNKMDLPSADLDWVKDQVVHDLGLDAGKIYPVSAKTGLGVKELLEGIVWDIPAPQGREKNPFKALIFDSNYDSYRGIVVHVRLFEGSLKPGDELRFTATGKSYKVEEVGFFQLGLRRRDCLRAGEVGYFIAGIKNIASVKIGDTVVSSDDYETPSLEGFREVKPVVFSSIYPVDTNDYHELGVALEKLKLNDASLLTEKDSSSALGFGFRCGFLGLLHLEVVQERIEREFNLSIIFTSPSVRYRMTMTDGRVLEIDNPAEYPGSTHIARSEEPYIKAMMITPKDYLGGLISLCTTRRGVQKDMRYLDKKRVELIYEMPLGEVLFDFYDQLKSISRGYASFDYEIIGYKETHLVKMDILVNGEPVDALAQLVFFDNAYQRGQFICKKLKEEIPRQQFRIPIQAAIGSKIISRETVSAVRKDVTAKCYGGDITRKRKLLEKQKEGKKRMKMVGNVELPQNAFLSVLKTG